MRYVAYENLTELWDREVRSMYAGPVDHVSQLDTVRYDNILSAQSMAFDFDLSREVGFSHSRWVKLINDYLDPSATRRFLDRSADVCLGDMKAGGTVGLGTRADFMREKHTFGNCIMGFTFHGTREEPVLSMHSRVSYLCYIAPLDLALARAVAAAIGERVRIGVVNFQFRWVVDALQFHGINSLPTLATRYRGLMNPTPVSPTEKLIARWWPDFREVVRGTPANFRPVMSAARRYRSTKILPKCPVTTLTLASLWRPGR